MSETGNHASIALGVVIVTLLFSGIVIGLRVYTRTFLRKGAFGLNDWLIVLAWVR